MAYLGAAWKEDLRKYMDAAQAACLTEEAPVAEQPPWITVPMRPHQQTLLAAALRLEEESSVVQQIPQVGEGGESPSLFVTKYGVLGDRVGAGKSLVALAMVRAPPPKSGSLVIRESGGAQMFQGTLLPAAEDLSVIAESTRDASGGWASGPAFLAAVMREPHGNVYTRTALFVVPHNVMPQWEEYARRQSGLRCQFVRRARDCDWMRPGFYQEMLTADAVIVSCTMLRRFMGAMSYHGPRFSRFVWSRVFLDEADSINVTARPDEIRGRFYWFITGSWLNMLFPTGLSSWVVQGLSGEMRTLIGDGVVRGVERQRNLVGELVATARIPEFVRPVLRNADDWIAKSLARPAVHHRTVLCRAPVSARLLRGFVTPAAMEALHAGDVAGAMSALGLRGASKEGIVERVTESLRKEVVGAEKTLAFKREMEYSSAAAKAEGVRRAEEKLVQLRSQLADLEGRVATAFGGTVKCPICYEPPATMTLTPCCRQAFCLACLCECVRAKPACPLCRVAIASPKELLVVGEGAEDVSGGDGAAAEGCGLPNKGEALLTLLNEAGPNDRFLVFSAHEASFKGLRAVLEARGERCEMLFGTAARVTKLRREFREGKIRVLCMNARHVGAGLNLESASHVVLYHRMNLELEKQVIGRAVRFERKEDLHVVHLSHEGETGVSYLTGEWADSSVITHV